MTERSRTQPDGDAELDRDRRDFLKAAGATGAVAAAAGAVTPGEAEAQEFPPDDPVRYQLTPHVARFYFLNRL